MSWVGGKKALREEVVRRFPLFYERYVEVFGGGGWVLFHKPPGNDFEVYNDYNGLLSNLYRCVRDKPDLLINSLKYVLNSREDFDRARLALRRKRTTDIQRAAWFYQVKIVTGTYNVPGNYKVVYKTNLNQNYRTMYDNLSTQQNYVLDASPAALGLASNEDITEFMVVFGVVPANFRQVEAPQVYCNVVSWLTGGTQFVNQADTGGVYNGQWIMATSRWVTKVYKPSEPLPRTGY